MNCRFSRQLPGRLTANTGGFDLHFDTVSCAQARTWAARARSCARSVSPPSSLRFDLAKVTHLDRCICSMRQFVLSHKHLGVQRVNVENAC